MSKNKPLHQMISEDLMEKILQKEYEVNDMIPKEVDLAEKYGVSRPTVRRAIKTLVDKGYLERIKGTGTFVRKRKINQEFTHVIRSYDDEIKSKGMIPDTRVINFSVQKSSQEIADKLEINTGDEVYMLTRLRFANKKPVVFVNTYIPASVYPNLIEEDFSKVSLYDTFARYGIPIHSAKRELNVIKSDYMSSAMLNIPINEPLFYFKTIGYSPDRFPIEYSISWYRGDYNTFIFHANI